MKHFANSWLAPVTNLFSENFGLSRALSWLVTGFITLMICLAVFWFVHSAPPRSVIMTSGPPGSSFEQNAEKCRAILARNGVALKILTSQGSLDNLQRLQNPAQSVDIGFVQGGVAVGTNALQLVSLGSVAYEPLLVFYRNPSPIGSLGGLAGKRLAIGPPGSGTRTLALTLLQTNGLTADGSTTFLDLDADAASWALLAGSVDAVFLMSDSASAQTMRTLLRSPGVKLLSFEQADAYSRRFTYLNKLRLPEGSIDFGQNLPPQDAWLIGPTVELIARPHLNSAVSDLLLEASQEVFGHASLLQNQGEFPKPLAAEFKLSDDAARYYKSGKTFLYSRFPFWLASLLNRFLVAFVPMIIILIPGLRLIPAVYKWRFRLRFQRWYRNLLVLERQLSAQPTPAQLTDMHERFDEIEKHVFLMKVPASFANQLYELRGHIDYVREKLAARRPSSAP